MENAGFEVLEVQKSSQAFSIPCSTTTGDAGQRTNREMNRAAVIIRSVELHE